MIKTITCLAMIFILIAGQNAKADSKATASFDIEANLQKWGIQLSWAACKQNSDCSLFTTVCGLKMAANTQYVREARNGYCALHDNCDENKCPIGGTQATSQLTYQMACYRGYCLAGPDNVGSLLQKQGVQPEWAACKDAGDCGLFPIMCGIQMAANKQYLSQAQNGYCAQHNGCSSENLHCPSPEIVSQITYPIVCAGYCLAEPNIPH